MDGRGSGRFRDVGVEVDADVGLFCADELLGADEGVPCGEVGVVRGVEVDVSFAAAAAFLEGLQDS